MTRDANARLFAALEIPMAVRTELARWARSARAGSTRLRLVEPAMLHLTLVFLGARPVSEIDEIASALVECAAPVPELGLGAPLWLGPRRPTVLAVEVHDETGALEHVHRQLVHALRERIDWEPERRRLRPHITVARMRAGSAPRERTLEATPALSFAAASLTLYRSWLSSAGAEYQPLAQAML